MNLNFLILKPEFVLKTTTNEGAEIIMDNRYSDGIITIESGLLEFDFGDTVILCADGQSVFVPKGLSYKIKCRKKAQSSIVNFYTDGCVLCPFTLPTIAKNFYKNIFNRLELLLQDTNKNRNMIFSLYYQLLSEFSNSANHDKNIPEIVKNAEKIMLENISNPSLSCKYISHRLNISEVYLRKLFSRYLNISPSGYLIKMRMEKARHFLIEGYSVTQTAICIGYSEIYQFSRAYKRYFGFSPSQTRLMSPL